MQSRFQRYYLSSIFSFIFLFVASSCASGGPGDTVSQSASASLFLEEDGNVLYDYDVDIDDVTTQLVQDQISSDGISNASVENPWYWLSLDLSIMLDHSISYRIVIHSDTFDPTNLGSLSTLDGAYCSLDGNASNETPPLCAITNFSLSTDDVTTLTGWDRGDVVGVISYTVEVDILDEEAAIVGSMVLTAAIEDLEWSVVEPTLPDSLD